MTEAPHYDAVVVGAGLGGLLAAATAADAGKSVLVVERLPYVGGRFTTVDQDGCQITTGALHLVPHGSGGPLARLLASIGQPFRPVPRDVIASVFVAIVLAPAFTAVAVGDRFERNHE